MKPRPGARSDSSPKNAAAAVDSATAKIADGEVVVAGGDGEDAGIAGDAEVAGVAERDHAAVAEHHVDRERKQRIDQHLGRHVDVELVADDPRQNQQRQRADGKRDGGAQRHICTRPNNPCGRNTSTSTIGRNSTK